MICAEEFAMADEAFALSPISARAAQPTEQDYEAISEAFMETSRGRWFLGEYAKRNRNADTRMVLDAVERIEQSLAAQRREASDSGLAEALAAIRSALDEARAVASAAIDSLALEENLAPVRKGARVIKEIAWRWREIGADARICDLIDSQVNAIESGCGRISSADASGALNAAFDLVEQRIAKFGNGDAAAEAAEQTAPPASPPPAPSDEMPAAAAEETMQAAPATGDPDAAASTAEMPAEAIVAATEAVEITAAAADVATEDAAIAVEAADAHDEAVLEMVAIEMAAPDASELDDAADPAPDEIHALAPPPAEPTFARETEPMAVPEPAMQPSLQPSLERPLDESPSLERPPVEHPPVQRSLGSTLIASGIVTKPFASASDPLAPIRRLSQAEKIALFS
jgi:hypothetical protein